MPTKQTQDMAELHEQILTGERETPPRFSAEGRAYAKWRKQEKRHAREMEKRQQMLGGITPVRGEKVRGAAKGRGFSGAHGGYAAAVSSPQEWQTTTNLGCGFNLNVVGAPAPMIGAPLGRHAITGAEIGCDPMSWFREGIIANPSQMIFSLPGLGKSTLVRKQLMAGVAAGRTAIIAGDIKAEYVGFVEQVGGQVITVGHGKGQINPLDVGALGRVIPQIERAVRDAEEPGRKAELEALRDRAAEQVHNRQRSMVAMLVGLSRGERIKDYEAMIISIGLRHLTQTRHDAKEPPLLVELIELLENGTPELREAARARTDEQWAQRIDGLMLSLNSLLDGPSGRIFAGQTTTPINVGASAVCIDVSQIDSADDHLKAAVMMACWHSAFGAVEAAHILADSGLGPQRYFDLVLDELWQVLAAAPGMVDEVDALTRLNRSWAVSLTMITHTFKDLQALPTEEDRQTAMGFIERAGMVISGGLPASELEILEGRLIFSPAEGQMVTSWSRGVPPKRSRSVAGSAVPPGRGRMMIKPSKDGAAGIPVQVLLTPFEQEHDLHDTNKRFSAFFAESAAEEVQP